MIRLVMVCVLAVLTTTPVVAELVSGRIVGGNYSLIQNYPYQVSVRYKNCLTCAFYHRCGGIIYSRRIIITSANCLSGISANKIHVVAGSNSIIATEGILTPVENFIIHENYNSLYIDYDVAVIKLALDLPLERRELGSIELATELPKAGSQAYVTGWGSVVEGGGFSERLKVTKVKLVSDKECKRSYGTTRISERMFCAGVVTGHADPCKGDSGGPLIVGKKLVGIVSWGRGCGRVGYPGVYTNIIALGDWIKITASSLD